MKIETFLQDFGEQFDETNPSDIKPDTRFRELDEWTSLNALSIIAMLDSKYNTKLSLPEFEGLTTVNDLFEFVLNNKKV